MPVDDFVDLNDDLTLSDLEKLDRQAQKAIKEMEKAQRRGGIFAGTRSNITTATDKSAVSFEGTDKLSKQDRRIEKKIERLTKKADKAAVKDFGKDKRGNIRALVGDDVGNQLFNIGKDPIGFVQNSLIGAAGAGFVLQVADTVIKEIQRLDRFFKVFVDRIDDRVDQLRSKQQQAEIQAGLTQVIITTQSGNIEARDAYNTFNEFNNNRAQLEEDYAIRNTSGYQ